MNYNRNGQRAASRIDRVGVQNIYNQDSKDEQGNSLNTYLSVLKHIFHRNKLYIRHLKHLRTQQKQIQHSKDLHVDQIQINAKKINKQKNYSRPNRFQRSQAKQIGLKINIEPTSPCKTYQHRYKSQKMAQLTSNQNIIDFNPIRKRYKPSQGQLFLHRQNKPNVQQNRNSLSFRINRGKSSDRNQPSRTTRAKTSCSQHQVELMQTSYMFNKKALISAKVSLREISKIFMQKPSPW